MQRLHVMAVTPDKALGRYLETRLSRARFEVSDHRPGTDFIEAAYKTAPHIAVLDHVAERGEMAQMEIALLKKRRPDVRIILVSSNSTEADASLVEQGIFFYLAGGSHYGLVRVVCAASRGLQDHSA